MLLVNLYYESRVFLIKRKLKVSSNESDEAGFLYVKKNVGKKGRPKSRKLSNEENSY